MIRNIYFTPGAFVQKGTLLVQLDIEPDVAQLASLEAMAKFYEITYKRDKAQYAVGAVSKETLDSDKANMENGVAQVIEQRANIAKKIIRAPFTGKLGISMVNPGQYLNPGDQIVALQTLDPIYVDFYVPQESIGQLAVGQPINVSIDSFPNETFSGKITTMNPLIDTNSRNVEVEGTLPNPKNKLLPGMFTDVTVVTGSPKKYITLPQTAINFNSYGDIIYILKPTNEKYNDKAVWEANEVFVTTGNTRGDQITVLTGVSVGDIVVTSGQLKLKNKSKVIINNDVQPSNDPDPRPITE
jgi:membrane fusion protein (multidrug efflux system)